MLVKKEHLFEKINDYASLKEQFLNSLLKRKGLLANFCKSKKIIISTYTWP